MKLTKKEEETLVKLVEEARNLLREKNYERSLNKLLEVRDKVRRLREEKN